MNGAKIYFIDSYLVYIFLLACSLMFFILFYLIILLAHYHSCGKFGVWVKRTVFYFFKCYLFLWRLSWIFSIITPVFSVTQWSFRNHSNIVIWLIWVLKSLQFSFNKFKAIKRLKYLKWYTKSLFFIQNACRVVNVNQWINKKQICILKIRINKVIRYIFN